MLTLVGGVAASCLFLVLAIFPRCGGRAFRLPAHPHAHALQVTLGWLTVLVALILSITRQWTRIYRIYVNGKTERFHHALTDWLSLRPLATPGWRGEFGGRAHHYDYHRPHMGYGNQLP